MSDDLQLSHTELLQAIKMILDKLEEGNDCNKELVSLIEELLTAVLKHEETTNALRVDLFKLMMGVVALSLVLAWIIR